MQKLVRALKLLNFNKIQKKEDIPSKDSIVILAEK